MALIKLGSLAQDVRGSQNGLTFSRNKGGAYVRQKVSPVQPRTPAQLAVRENFSLNTKRWSGTMTQADRDSWTAYATTYPYTNVFGDASVLTGLAMSVARNQVLNQCGVASILAAPTDNSVTPIPVVLSFQTESGPFGLDFSTAAQAAPADTLYYVFATPALPAGRNPGESIYRFLNTYAPVAAATTVDLTDDWSNLFGAAVSGQIIWAVIAQVSKTKGNITVGQKFSTVYIA